MGRPDLENYGPLRKISSRGEKLAEIPWPRSRLLRTRKRGARGKGEPSLPTSDIFGVTEKSISETDVKDSP